MDSLGSIDNPIDENAGEHFGISVSLSSDGTILGIGATGIDSDNIDVGAVFVYSLSETMAFYMLLKI